MARGQISLEYMFLLIFTLALMGILWSVSRSDIENTQWEIQLAGAQHALTKVTQAADTVYLQGTPAQLQIFVDLPANVNAVTVENNTVSMELVWKDSLRLITQETLGSVSGTISTAAGRHTLLVTAGQPIEIVEV